MPRIDNSQPYTDVVNQAILDMWGSTKNFRPDFNYEDPGDTPPIDLCRLCFNDMVEENYIDEYDALDHPPYGDPELLEDMVYQCAVCGEILTEEDDG